MRGWAAVSAALCAAVGLVCLWAEGAQDASEPGLVYVRFNSYTFARPMDTGVIAQVNVDTGTTINDYSQIMAGLLRVPTDAPILFSAEADNGLRLYLGDKQVIAGWDENGPHEGMFQDKAGVPVPLRIEYFQDGGTGHLRLYWQWEGHARELVPESAFFHTQEDARFVEAVRDGKENPMAREDRSVIYQPGEGIPGHAPDAELPVPARPGPHLLLDDYLIEASSGVERVIMQPQRNPDIPNPIVTSGEDRSFQPYLTVLRDPDTGRYRMWYGIWRDDKNPGRSQLATMESEDGIHFIRPHRVCDTPEIQFGSEVIDRGPAFRDPAARYAYSYWWGGGMCILVSPDGLSWTPLVEGPVLPHDHDITGIDWDPIRETYVATVSTYTTGANWTGQRRTTMMSWSDDFIHWEKCWYALTASDALDDGQTQFYAMDGYLTRGPLRIGMVKVLRDDLVATGTAQGSFGRAHTSLAWSRDGRTWVRDRAMFFEPDDDPAAWDHAHAWIDEQLVVGDEVHLYYGGYKQGHKMNRFEERQIGLVTMKLDRYAARRAGGRAGTLTTVPIALGDRPGTLFVNADAAKGRLRVQVRDADTGKVLTGLAFADAEPLTDDGIRQRVSWRGRGPDGLAGRTVQLEFQLTNADLFAFEFSL